MMKLLLTGFEPFGGEHVNASWEAVCSVCIPQRTAEIVRLKLPTVFGQSASVLTGAMRQYRPDAVLCVGQASGRSAVTVERIAINLMDARIPDNAGAQPVDEPVAADGPAAYFTTLPVKKMVAAIRGQGIAAAVSDTAGTYVCNQLLYAGLHYAALYAPDIRVGFIHVPRLTEQLTEESKDGPSMDRQSVVLALTEAVRVIAG